MKISEALQTTTSKLKKQGVADSFLGIDSRLHIDPALLRTTRVPEFREAAEHFEKYFTTLITSIGKSKPGGPLESQIISCLVFPEVSSAALGFSKESSEGRAVSRALAAQLYATARELIDIGVSDPAIFELLVLFEEKFGPDLISDMTLWIILDQVSAFNERVCRNLGIPTKDIKANPKHGRTVTAAYSKSEDKPILLLPCSLLSELIVANSRDDISRVVQYNEAVRAGLNKWLGNSWTKAIRELSKQKLKEMLISNPPLLAELVRRYKAHRATPYNFESDPLGEVIWNDLGKDFAKRHPLDLSISGQDEFENVIIGIVKQFKRLVEQNGLWKHLYSDAGKQRPEKFSQLLFYAVADSYCKANDLDLSAEPNAGRGPVDFKMSGGYDQRGLVEIKLSSNGAALDGLLAQLPTYAVAEQATFSLFLLIVVGKTRDKVDKIKRMHGELTKGGKKVPEIFIVEAHKAKTSLSASKQRYSYGFEF